MRDEILRFIAEAAPPPEVQALALTRQDGRDALLVIVTAPARAFRAAGRVELGGGGPALEVPTRVPVVLRAAPGPARPEVLVPRPLAEGSLPEQETLDPLVMGAQVQNADADERDGLTEQGFARVGTLGLFARDADGGAWMVSNNHVLANEDRAEEGDRIFQSSVPAGGREVARLGRWVPLVAEGDNLVDAAAARLGEGVAWRADYHACRPRRAPDRVAAARLGGKVAKVGRTTGLTLGRVVGVAARVRGVRYATGPKDFAGSLVIEGEGGATFSAGGDSGSAIVADGGALVGLLYAGNGVQTFACPARESLEGLGLELAEPAPD